MLDDTLLTDFMRTFYGYGNLHGDYWFIGMEEGGGHSCDEIAARLQTWDARGRRALEDVAAYHRAFGVTNLFEAQPKIQNTWGKLIRVLLTAEGQTQIDAQRVREFQRDRLGRLDSNHCLLELLPLPSRSLKPRDWLYNKCSNLKDLQTRDRYRVTTAPYRIARLQEWIRAYRPAHIIFYGFNYRREYWEKIADVPMREYSDIGCIIGRNAETIFTIIKHPAAHGVTNDYFDTIGRLLRPR